MKTIFELAAGDTTTTEARGTQRTTYALEPTIWLREILDAAKKRHFFAQFAFQGVVQPGNKDIIVPYRTAYMQPADWEASVGEGVAVTYTTMSNLDGVTIAPADTNYGIAISNRALRINALDLVRAAKDELVFRAGDAVDIAVALKIGDATAATSTVRGAQTVYGGDARAESELATGDTLTTDMIADAKTKLQSTTCKYWNPASPAAEGTSSAKKNPWASDAGEPFVFGIAPEQENVLLKDSQFINAAEYGGREVIMNGEIGRYLGVKIFVAPNTEAFTTSSSADGGGNAGAVGHRCLMFKARRAIALAWGQKPALRVFDYPSELERRLILEMAYATTTVHNDAVVFVDVADA